MMDLAALRDTNSDETGDEGAEQFLPKAELPMDFLVKALGRAVMRKQSAETKET